MQLISYCLLVGINREKPKRGLIQYGDGEPFFVEHTDELKDKLLGILEEMRTCIRTKVVRILGTINVNKCNGCKYNKKCNKINVRA